MTADVNGYGPDLSGLGASPWELQQLEEVMAEVADGGLDDLPDDGTGPWDDEAGLAAYDLGDVAHMVDLATASEQQRLAEDGWPLPRKAEDKISWLMGRVERGSYLPPIYFREPEPSYGCGQVDSFGRCSARFHGAYCLEAARGSAATSDATAAEAWRAALNRNTAIGDPALLASPMDTEDQPGPADDPALSFMRRALGIGG
jgi:hypothetical protein